MLSRAVFESLIDEHHEALYRYALWMIGETEMAMDLVQETYYQAWKSRKSLRDEAKAFYWLLTILRRSIFREYSRQKKVQSEMFISETEQSAQTDNVDIELMVDLGNALQRMPEKYRDILLLYSLYGMSYVEIAAYLDLPLGTVTSRIARARQALQKDMKETGIINDSKVVTIW